MARAGAWGRIGVGQIANLLVQALEVPRQVGNLPQGMTAQKGRPTETSRTNPMPPIEPSSDVLVWIVAVWLFALGGAIGSFLNVVVYRVPAGMSLVEPGSHCPHCKRPIRWFDNVPILAWILLWGRCRD